MGSEYFEATAVSQGEFEAVKRFGDSKRQSRTVKSPNTASTQKSRSTSKKRERVGAKRDSRAS